MADEVENVKAACETDGGECLVVAQGTVRIAIATPSIIKERVRTYVIVPLALQRPVFATESDAGEVCAREDTLVCNSGTVIDIVGSLGEDVPMGRGPEGEFANHGAVTEKVSLVVRGSVHEVQLE